VSVRTVDEALQAAAAGADFIDLKEPREGALGALPVHEIERIVAALRTRFPGLPVSATTGDFDDDRGADILAAVERVARCGVDYVKVGIVRGSAAAALVEQLARSGRPVVPVLLCDGGLDVAAMHAACRGPFPALMADTRDKAAGGLFDCVATATLAWMLETARAHGKLAGLSGALRMSHAAQLAALAPDFAGFRGAVCRGDRTGDLDAQKVRDLARTMRDAEAAGSVAVGQ
jgi:(5-formylfuran-3-yl)methyl phosphate synthase